MKTPDDVADLEPQGVWRHFLALSRIPRSSGDEERAAEYTLEVARKNGWSGTRDSAGNVVIRVPAKDARSTTPVALQAHLDMVCVSAEGYFGDFATHGVEIIRGKAVVDDVLEDVVTARNTSAGFDDGIGVAAALAAAEDPKCVHPPLELIFTVDEEVGFSGAAKIDRALVSSKRLVNLDGFLPDAVRTGSAGAIEVAARFELRRKPAPPGALPLAITISGLTGGHSGLEIFRGGKNAIVSLCRSLMNAVPRFELEIGAIRGGQKSNAIPQSATAVVWVAEKYVSDLKRSLAADPELSALNSDPGLKLKISDTEEASAPIENGAALISTLATLPNGVLDWRAVDLPETSSNLGVVDERDGKLFVSSLVRSFSDAASDAVAARIHSALSSLGAVVTSERGSRSWISDGDSPLVRAALAATAGEFPAPRIIITHSTIEPNVFRTSLPEISEMISIGPRITGHHTVSETLVIRSVETFYTTLRKILGALADA